MIEVDGAMPYIRGTLYADLRRDCGGAWDAYVDHRFVEQLATGVLPRAEFLAWMVQDYLYLIQFTRAYALLIVKSATVGRMRAAAHIVSSLLDEEMSLHRDQLAAAGILEADLDQAPETLETLAYGRYVMDRAQSGDALDLTVTLSACLVGYGEIGLRLLADPRTKLEGNPYRDWIETYGGAAYHALAAEGVREMEALSCDLGGRTRYPMLLSQFRQAVRLEALFWNAGASALAAA